MILLLLLAASLQLSAAQQSSGSVELAFDIWDWTPPAKDLETFEKWVADLENVGFNRVEMSVPWRVVEPSPGKYDLTWVRDRQTICRKHGMGMRLRINSYWANALPDWYDGDIWMDSQQKQAFGFRVPSINDERFWQRFAPMCTAISSALRGEDVLYSPFIGIHAEVKYADWWTYDPSSMVLWRKCITDPRPPWLTRLVANADLPTTPPVPAATKGLPDKSPAAYAFIGFREWTLRKAFQRFRRAIIAGDPDAKVSTPLGESYRRESASMANLDYWGLSRGSSQVVHSYDFMLHSGKDPLWPAKATIAAFQGISQRPVIFEFDSPKTMAHGGYSEDTQAQLVDTALAAGAGLKFANFSGSAKLPHEWPVIRYAGKAGNTPHRNRTAAPPDRTVLLFFSKWANYAYREPTEWLHDAQFGWWKVLHDAGIPSRVICEDNLDEDLTGYRAIVLAFSPLDLLPVADRRKLHRLDLPYIRDFRKTPAMLVDNETTVTGEIGELIIPQSSAFYAMDDLATSHSRPLLQGPNQSFAHLGRGGIDLGFSFGYTYLYGSQSNDQTALVVRMLEILDEQTPRTSTGWDKVNKTSPEAIM